MSKKAWRDFAVDSVIAVAFILSALGGIVLYLAPGGYQGGRNPYYGREVLFLGHDAWNGLHTWTSFVLLAGVLVHLALHWKWTVCMAKRMLHLGQRHASTAATKASLGACPGPASGEM